MYYVNQRNYPHVSYPTMTGIPELLNQNTTVCSAGCGLCSASMVVTNMLGKEFSLIDCLELSVAVGANHSPGTDMEKLAPYIAERFNLELVMTEDPELLRSHLAEGFMAIANVTGDRPEDGYTGVFSHGGHYVAVVSIDADNDHITILDPSQVPGKYEEEGRHGKVLENGIYLHTTMAVLAEDCKYRLPKYYPDGEFKSWLDHIGNPESEPRYFLFRPKSLEIVEP